MSPLSLAALDGRPTGWLDEQSRAALAQVPLAARWARGFTGTVAISANNAPETAITSCEGMRAINAAMRASASRSSTTSRYSGAAMRSR